MDRHTLFGIYYIPNFYIWWWFLTTCLLVISVINKCSHSSPWWWQLQTATQDASVFSPIKASFFFRSFYRQRGTRTFAHLQQDRPLRHVDPVRASRRPHRRHADRPHRALPRKPVLPPPLKPPSCLDASDRWFAPWLQVRRAILQMLFPTKAFNWLRHIAIALTLLTLINMLVIFAPNILGIFGIIGRFFTDIFVFCLVECFFFLIRRDGHKNRTHHNSLEQAKTNYDQTTYLSLKPHSRAK